MGNAICFIRLFYKPDIQFVLEDLVTDYSVNSRIITITRERGEKERERWLWRGGGCQHTWEEGSQRTESTHGYLRGGRPGLREGLTKRPQRALQLWSHPSPCLFKSSDSLLTSTGQ